MSPGIEPFKLGLRHISLAGWWCFDYSVHILWVNRGLQSAELFRTSQLHYIHTILIKEPCSPQTCVKSFTNLFKKIAMWSATTRFGFPLSPATLSIVEYSYVSISLPYFWGTVIFFFFDLGSLTGDRSLLPNKEKWDVQVVYIISQILSWPQGRTVIH